MLVRFSDQDEFVEELTRDPHTVARNLVRVTTNRYPAHNGVVTRIVVVGTAKVLSQALGAVEVEAEEKDHDVIVKANLLVDQLQGKAEKAGFRVGAGRYENKETMHGN